MGPPQDSGFRGRQMGQFVGREEAGNVPGTVGTEMIADPFGNAAQHGRIVVAPGNDVGARLHVDAERVCAGNGIEHRLHAGGGADVAVEGIVQALDVGTQHVHHRRHRFQGLVGDETVGHVHRVQAGLAGQMRDVQHVLEPHRRLRIGEGDALDAMAPGRGDDFLGRDPGGGGLAPRQFVECRHAPGDLEVVAAAAAEVAAITADGHDSRPRAEMAYRLVLDGPHVDGGEDAIGKVVQGAMAVDVGLAETPLAVLEPAAPQAQVAAGGAVVEPFLQAGFDQPIAGGLGGSGHDEPRLENVRRLPPSTAAPPRC